MISVYRSSQEPYGIQIINNGIAVHSTISGRDLCMENHLVNSRFHVIILRRRFVKQQTQYFRHTPMFDHSTLSPRTSLTPPKIRILGNIGVSRFASNIYAQTETCSESCVSHVQRSPIFRAQTRRVGQYCGCFDM